MSIESPRKVDPRSQGRKGSGATSGGDGPPQRGSDFLLPRPGVSLPRGGGALRGIDETFEANPVTGTASLSIPLGLSPGHATFAVAQIVGRVAHALKQLHAVPGGLGPGLTLGVVLGVPR